ncbi:hypothetical protein ES706_05174 [subsurface metagenome]
MIIQPGTKLLGDLVAEFCSQKGLGKPPGSNPNAKEPWEMTKADFMRKSLRDAFPTGTAEGKPFEELTDEQAIATAYAYFVVTDQTITHKKLIQQALREGKPVPIDVLADYPDLQKGSNLGEYVTITDPGKTTFKVGEVVKVNLYSREEYIEETGDDKTAARFSASKDQISLSPDIVSNISRILHELKHHYQSSRDGAAEFDRKYDEYTKTYGYIDNPYEVEAREFEMKWWPEFERLLKKKLEESGIA